MKNFLSAECQVYIQMFLTYSIKSENIVAMAKVFQQVQEKCKKNVSK